LIVMAEHFLLTPQITGIGRFVDDLPATDPEYKRFWMLHGLYSGLDILKMLIGFACAFRLAVRRRPDREKFAREFEPLLPAKESEKRMAAGKGKRG
jgi:hypothetical protein